MLSIVDRVARRLKKYNPFRQQSIVSVEKMLSIVRFPPNYLYRDNLPEQPVAMDVGCAGEAEFAQWMINECGARAYAVDPTRKHRDELQRKEKQIGEAFVFLPIAVTSVDGMLTFHESVENESGSVLAEHTNVLNDRTHSYDVRGLSIPTLLTETGEPEVHILKLDLEGAEYELISSFDDSATRNLHQVFVEFHHHCTPYTIRDTRQRVRHMESLGFGSFTVDDHNFLFYRP